MNPPPEYTEIDKANAMTLSIADGLDGLVITVFQGGNRCAIDLPPPWVDQLIEHLEHWRKTRSGL